MQLHVNPANLLPREENIVPDGLCVQPLTRIQTIRWLADKVLG